jgi:hypothetical protein
MTSNPHTRLPRTIVVLAAGASVLMAAACGGSGGSSGGKPTAAKDWAAYNAEFLRERATLQMPPGVTWPKQGLAEPTFQGTANTFEDGVGRGEADALWYCAWERRWLADQSRDPKAASQDLATMRGLADTPRFTVSTLPGDRHIFTDAWSRAALGDPSLIQQDVTVNCAGSGIAKQP